MYIRKKTKFMWYGEFQLSKDKKAANVYYERKNI